MPKIAKKKLKNRITSQLFTKNKNINATNTSLCFSTDKAKSCLKDIGIEDYNFKTGELWTYCGYKKRDGAVKVALCQGFDAVELATALNLGVILKLHVH